MFTMVDSLKYAYHGFKDALRSEGNLSVHLLFGLIAIIFAYFLDFSLIEYAILTTIIFLVIVLELINTIVEKLVDMHSMKISEEARVIKDISASVVLIASIMALIVGAFLFVPKII